MSSPPVFVCGLCGVPNCSVHLSGLHLEDPWTDEDQARLDFFRESTEAHQRAKKQLDRDIEAAVERLKRRTGME